MSVQGRSGRYFSHRGIFKMCKTTIKALRYYEEAGLLKPERTDPFTGYRFYTTDQLVQVHRIQALRQTGLSIDEIRLILSGRDQRDILKRRRAELEAELAETENQLSRLEFMLREKRRIFLWTILPPSKNCRNAPSIPQH